ncbi:iron-sulfur cluster repair di-iron protein [Rubrolithibacter danxiaensis]|uniref:iron-sulfur cluster repair di-iron protein n=1 Tax=Rubrolithibacter danxiaensis TaxID=3390805 RepID=UPI003BF82D65
METISILDVTVIEPRFKHPTIFQKFDSLAPAESFVIHNDHDPKPLYYQLLAERGQTFSWEYLESGPEIWKVKIAKRGAEASEETIGEIVAKDYRKAQVFKKFGIDFCCGGKKTLTEVCEKKGIDADAVEKELSLINGENKNSENDFQKWDIGFLSDYIINTHHQYVKENTAFINELAHKVARVHGDRHPEAISVAEVFSRIGQDLTLHMAKEEKILFPFIKELANTQKNGGMLQKAAFGKVSNPIQLMEMEHEQAGEDFETIRELTDDYRLPADACSSYTILYKKLEEYENDLNRHVHLENNILFPKAIQVEKELTGV